MRLHGGSDRAKTFKNLFYFNTIIHYLLRVSCHILMTAAEGTMADSRSVSDMSLCVSQATARPSTPPAHSSPASPPQMSCTILGHRSIVQPRSWRWGRIKKLPWYRCGYVTVNATVFDLLGLDICSTHSLQISPETPDKSLSHCSTFWQIEATVKNHKMKKSQRWQPVPLFWFHLLQSEVDF